jgi:hypothetical protein
MNAALHLWDGEAPDPSAPIAGIAVESADTVEAALGKIRGAKVADSDRSFFEDRGFDVQALTTDIRDLRPYSHYVIVSQLQGTMHCAVTAMLRADGDRLVPVPAAQTSEGDVCWMAGLTALRIGHTAYPAVDIEDVGPGTLGYSLALQNPEGPIGTETGFCKVTVAYQPQSIIADWNVAPGADAGFISRLRATLDPVMTDPGRADAALSAMAPAQSDGSAYDVFLRARGVARLKVLDVLDAEGSLSDMPLTDAGYTQTNEMPAYPIGFEQRRFILFFGQPSLGWRTWPDNAFALWEWKDKKLVPLASGYVEKRADHPTITVE